VLLASRLGQIKRLAVESLRLCHRGDLGQIGLRFLERSDSLVDLRSDGASVVGVRLQPGSLSLRLLGSTLPVDDASTPGQSLPLPSGQMVAELVPLISA
jgi:DNA gyrase subunit A